MIFGSFSDWRKVTSISNAEVIFPNKTSISLIAAWLIQSNYLWKNFIVLLRDSTDFFHDFGQVFFAMVSIDVVF